MVQVGKYNYLAVKITNNSNEETDMERITKGTNNMATLSRVYDGN